MGKNAKFLVCEKIEEIQLLVQIVNSKDVQEKFQIKSERLDANGFNLPALRVVQSKKVFFFLFWFDEIPKFRFL